MFSYTRLARWKSRVETEPPSNSATMNRLKILFLIFLATLICLSETQSQAKEGFFFEDSLLPQLQSAWEATFNVLSKSKGGGTAFLVDKQALTSSRTQLFFLSSDHTITTICGPDFLGHCPHLYMTASFGIDNLNNSRIPLNNLDRSIYEVEVVDRRADYDIALLRATVDRSKYESLRPIPLADCDSLLIGQEMYAIGFPNTSKRRRGSPITNPHQVTRRWSLGHISVKVRSKTYPHGDQNLLYRIGTTADALPGNSGGPALTQNGEFFGVLQTVYTKDGIPGYPFRGDEGPKSWHSSFTNCPATTDFLSP